MNRRQAAQTAMAVCSVASAAVLRHVMSDPASPWHFADSVVQYPWYIDAMALSSVALLAYVGTGSALHNRDLRRQAAAEEAAAAERLAAIHQAADMVITARPRDDFPGRTCTPAAVARYAATAGVVGVTLEEADAALRARLAHRGFSGTPSEADSGNERP